MSDHYRILLMQLAKTLTWNNLPGYRLVSQEEDHTITEDLHIKLEHGFFIKINRMSTEPYELAIEVFDKEFTGHMVNFIGCYSTPQRAINAYLEEKLD